MRLRFKGLLTAVLFIAISVFLTVQVSANEPEWLGTGIVSGEEPVRVDVPISDKMETRIIFEIAGAELYSALGRTGIEVEIPGEGHTSVEGVPSLPTVSRLVAIPAQARVSFEYEFGDMVIMEDVDLLPTMHLPIRDLEPGAELFYDDEIFGADRIFPLELVEIGRAAIMRDLRVVRVTVNPVRYNPVERILTIYGHIEVTLRYESGGTVNTLSAEPTTASRSFANLYESRVVNFKHLNLELDQEWGTLLVIAPNDPTVLSYTQTLVDWKIRKGMSTILVNTSVTGTSSSQIKNYIQGVYNTSDPQLAYLIMIGDCSGTISVPASNSYGDHDYTLLEGNDILGDISVGRFSCANTNQLLVEVYKVVNYESNPYMGETDWYKKGAVVAGSSLSGISTIMTKQGIRMKALVNDYTQVDTLWYTMGGSVTTFTNNEINAGIGFYNYRGWLGMSSYSISNIAQLTNYNKLPFVTTITCGTGDITSSESDYTEEFFRVGSPYAPTGAIGAIGTATMGTHTRYNNCVDNGIYGAFFDYDIFQMGDALNVGKFDLYMSFPDNSSMVASYSNWNNLIGDPSCQLWTDIPKSMVTAYTDTIPVGTTSLTVTVTDSISGGPLEGVDVCLSGMDIYLFALSDENGEALFSLPDLEAGFFLITVCIHNYKPHLDRVILENEDVFVSYNNIDINDDNTGASSGNSNGAVNPGETIELGLMLKNYGTTISASEIAATLSSSSEFITIIDSMKNYPNLSPGATSAYQYYVFSVDQTAVNQLPLPFYLEVSTSQGTWESYLELTAEAAEIVFVNCTVQDPNGQLDPGDTAPLLVTVRNMGPLTGDNLQAELHCANDYITVNQNVSALGSIEPGQSAAGNPFQVTVSPMIVNGATVDFDLYISGDNGFTDTTSFELVVGDITDSDPTGPDEYGYYALDNTDTNYVGYPIFDWIEIDPNNPSHIYNGIDVGLSDYGNEQDDTRLLALPFDFTYYSEVFDEISVCSNGWAAFGDMTYYTHFRNWYIPSTLGPYSLVAPFWDDLYQQASPPKKVYYYNDQENHRLIIEWNVKCAGSGNPNELFEVILLDPAYYPTATGDGIIIFYYADVSNVIGSSGWDNYYATVGIKSPDNLMGLQYSYWNYYNPGAAILVDGRAIKFTTDQPINASPPVIVHNPLPDVTEPVSGYTVEAQVSGYYPLDYDNMFIYWSTERYGVYNEELLTPSTVGSPDDFMGVIPEVEPGNIVYYYLYVQDISGGYKYSPVNAPTSVYSFMVGPQELVLFEDAEEEAGWSLGVAGDDATSGIWIRDDPVISIADNGHVVQPEDDYTIDPGHICFVTGNADPGAPGGTNDVDGGKTTIMSPIYDLSDYAHPIISFWYWYSNNQGSNPSQDDWRFDVSNNNGAVWLVVINTNVSTAEQWEYYQFWLEDYVSPTDQIRMRFIASDEGGGSLVEACVDDISIVNLGDTWGEWTSYEMIPAENISISAAGDDIHLSWLPVEGAAAYRVISGDTPYFDYEDGVLIGEYSETEIMIEKSSPVEFFRIKVVR